MRFIHQVIDEARAWHDDEVTPLGSALEELLGGERGSLPELADRFTEAGLGYIMASWIGNGPNVPISPHNLRRILGKERAEELATVVGLPSEQFLEQLARALPAAVHRMTPEGVLDRAAGAAGGRDAASD
jgi:uncharacterized protein YidB (DUF937 family)